MTICRSLIRHCCEIVYFGGILIRVTSSIFWTPRLCVTSTTRRGELSELHKFTHYGSQGRQVKSNTLRPILLSRSAIDSSHASLELYASIRSLRLVLSRVQPGARSIHLGSSSYIRSRMASTTSPSLKRKAEDLAAAEHKKPKQNGSITAFFGAPKSKVPASPAKSAATTATTVTPTKASDDDKTTTTTTVATPFGIASSTITTTKAPFDKTSWAAKLTPEQTSLLQLELTTLDESWLSVLAPALLDPTFLSLKRFLLAEHTRGAKIFPPAADVYTWSRHTPLDRVKAVILGQDPYHNDNQAHGLCFSVRPPTKAPPSLKNMYIALKKDYPSFRPPPDGLGLLTPWADSGVLLLNTCLTVRAHQANSHAGKGWESFTQKVIDAVNRKSKGVVFLAWGKPAEGKVKGVDTKKHLVLKSVHPSPLSASRGFVSVDL